MLLSLTGILSEVVVFSTLLACRSKTKTFSIRDEPFSHFGTLRETSRVFHIGLLVYLTFRTLFVGKIIDYFSLWGNPLVGTSYAFALVSMLFVSVFTFGEKATLHSIFARFATASSVAFLGAVSYELMKKSIFLGVFNMLIFLWLLFSSLAVLRRKTNALSQLYFFVPIVLWDWVMTATVLL